MTTINANTRPENGTTVHHGRYDWTGTVVADPPGSCLGACRDGSVSFAVRWSDGTTSSANTREVTEPSQLTIDGRDVPCAPAQPSGKHEVQPLFTAPQTIRGQLAMPTDRETR